MKIDTQLKVVAADGVEKAVASELEVEDDDLEKLLAEQEQSEADEAKDTEDDTESL